MSDLSQKGIDPKLIDSAIHQVEFRRKEITNTPYPYGIKLLLAFSSSWFHGGSPEDILLLDKILSKINKEISDLRAEIAGLTVKQENFETKLNSILKQKQCKNVKS